MKQSHRVSRKRGKAGRCIFGALTMLAAATMVLAKPVKIERITPSGEEVGQERGIYIEFNRPMAPLGLSGSVVVDVPVTISPIVECEWTWVKRNVLACHIAEPHHLQKSTKYRVSIEPGIFAEDGETLEETVIHEFTTELPRIRYSRVIGWQSPRRPFVLIELNQPVSGESLKGRVEFLAGSSKGIASEIWPADWVLRQHIEENYFGGDRMGESLEEAGSQIQLEHEHTIEDSVASSSWILFPESELPTAKLVSIRLNPGIESTMGTATHLNEQVYDNVFKTFDEFRLLGIQCTNAQGDQIGIDRRSSSSVRCVPERSIALLFSTPVRASQLQPCLDSIEWFSGEIKDPWFFKSPSPWNVRRYSPFGVTLPKSLKPFAEYSLTLQSEHSASDASACRSMKDVFGRELVSSQPLTFRTDHYSPLARAWNRVSVFESSLLGDTTIHAMNVRDLRLKYDVISPKGSSTGLIQEFEVGDKDDSRNWWPLGLREKTGDASGVVIGELTSAGRFDGQSLENWFLAISTPYHIFAKQGPFETLVWVTGLESGKPVEGANVHQYLATTSNPIDRTREKNAALTNEHGVAMLPGYFDFNPTLKLKDRGYLGHCREDDCPMTYVSAVGPEGLGLLPLAWNFYVRPTAISSTGWIRRERKSVHGYIHAWGTTAQGIYRRGDDVEFKGYVRDKTSKSLGPAPRGSYSVTVQGPSSNVLYEESDIWLNEFGSFDGNFRIPEGAMMGWYRFKLKFHPIETSQLQEQSTDDSEDLSSVVSTEMKFFVTDFTPNPLRVMQEFNADEFEQGDELQITTRGEFHAGGPYANAEVQVRVRIDSMPPKFTGPITEKFRFDYSHRERQKDLYDHREQSNDSGILESTVDLLSSDIYFGRLVVESSVRSDRGKYVSETSVLPYHGVDRFVGLKKQTSDFFREGEAGFIEAIVVDENGKTVLDERLEIKFQRRDVLISRVRTGDVYQPRYVSQWVDTHQSCEVDSSDNPVVCSFTPEVAGRYRAVASIVDSKGREQLTDLQIWVTGRKYVAWDSGGSTRLEMWCDRTQPNVGDRVKCIVQNTLPGGEALITIEREGILDYFVQRFESSTPVLEFTVQEEYVPGFYLSVLVTSPRIAEPSVVDSSFDEQSDTVDLGKPTFRQAYARFEATNQEGNIDVTVSTNSTKFRPRDEVAVRIGNTNRSLEDAEVEYAVLVIDEAVLDLVGEGLDYFDPSKGFHQLSPLGIETFGLTGQLLSPTLQGDPTALIHLKGTSAGGGGATDESRNIKKYVAYWNPSIRSIDGRARFSFKLPDNLTAWRIVVLAATSESKFGLGHTSIQSTKDTELRPIVPNVVTEGDSFQVGVSVLNRTDRDRNLNVQLNLDGLLSKEVRRRITRRVQLGPFGREQVMIGIDAGTIKGLIPESGLAGKIDLLARASDSIDTDTLTVQIPVRSSRSAVSSVDYGVVSRSKESISYELPEFAVPGTGHIEVEVSGNVIGSLDGAFSYVRSYPFGCWEQRLSKGLLAAQFNELGKDYVHTDFTWDDSVRLPQETLDSAANYQASNGGMSFFGAQDRHVSPYLSAYTAMGFRWFEEMGLETPKLVKVKLNEYLLSLLRNKDSMADYPRNLVASLRSVILNALAKSDHLSTQDMRRYSSEIAYMDLFGLSNYLQALIGKGGNEDLVQRVFDRVMDHRTFVDGGVEFVDVVPGYFNTMLHSSSRSSCTVLAALVDYAENFPNEELVADLAEVAKVISLYREKRSHWTNTQENVFCMNALVRFSSSIQSESREFDVQVAAINSDTGKNTRLVRGTIEGTGREKLRVMKLLGDALLGKSGILEVSSTGDGNAFYSARMSYLVPAPQDQTRLSGMELDRAYFVERDGELIELKPDMVIQRGELVRTSLFLNVPSARYFVVVDDSVPGGIEPVNRELATESETSADFGSDEIPQASAWYDRYGKHKNRSRWFFYHDEIAHANVRFYADILPAGKYHLHWVGQAISSGKFHVVAAHTEEMYRPSVFGKSNIHQLSISD